MRDCWFEVFDHSLLFCCDYYFQVVDDPMLTKPMFSSDGSDIAEYGSELDEAAVDNLI